jgi:predicted Holliday junction resolvase-like endonuclease
MDLMVLIVIVIAGLLVYYLIDTIKSLQKEISEIKDKCITTKNSTSSDFTVTTADPMENISENVINILNKMKDFYN